MSSKFNQSRVWLDTTVLALLDESQTTKSTLDQMIKNGFNLVASNTAIDARVFRKHLYWTDQLLDRGYLIIEMWNTLDEMVSKEFYWSSFGITTPACQNFQEAIRYLSDQDRLLKIANLIKRYSLPKGVWPMGKWAPPISISEEDASALGVAATATRTEILAAAKKTGKFDTYSRYNRGYVKGLAQQHQCQFILNADGTISGVTE